MASDHMCIYSVWTKNIRTARTEKPIIQGLSFPLSISMIHYHSKICCIIFQIIYFDNNPIAYIDPRAFDGLTQLNLLTIHSHEIKEALKLTSGVKSLIELKLNNVAEDFENMDFKPFVVLEGLCMTRGELTNIPQNIEYISGTICYLSFAYNHIATLDGMFNITFEKLRSLYLLHNKISIINPQLLKFPLLKHIYLQNNRLKQLEDMRFSNWGIGHYGILSMAIKPNPWHCNESTAVLIKTLCRREGFAYFREEPIRIGLSFSDMVCESPIDVKGEAFKFVFQVAIQEMDQCPKSEFLEAHRPYHLFSTIESVLITRSNMI